MRKTALAGSAPRHGRIGQAGRIGPKIGRMGDRGHSGSGLWTKRPSPPWTERPAASPTFALLCCYITLLAATSHCLLYCCARVGSTQLWRAGCFEHPPLIEQHLPHQRLSHLPTFWHAAPRYPCSKQDGQRPGRGPECSMVEATSTSSSVASFSASSARSFFRFWCSAARALCFRRLACPEGQRPLGTGGRSRSVGK